MTNIPQSSFIETVARAICDADPLAPEPDAPILDGNKNCAAWEARVPMAQAAIDAIENEMKRACERGHSQGKTRRLCPR